MNREHAPTADSDQGLRIGPAGRPPDPPPAFAPPRRRSWAARTAWISLLLGATVLYAIPLWWGLPPGREWAFDEPDARHIVPESLGESGREWMDRYPPLHRLLLRGLFLVVMPAWESPAGALDLGAVPRLQQVGRAASVLFALATLLLVFRLATRLGGRAAGWYAALFWLGVAPQTFYAKTMNLDAPYLAWYALSLYFFLELRERDAARPFVAFALAGGAAILTKDQAYGLYVLPALAILCWRFATARAAGASRPSALRELAGDRRLWAAATALVLQVAVVYRLWNGFDELADHVAAMTGERWMGRFREFPNSFGGHLGLAGSSARNLLFCLGWPAAIVSVAAVLRQFDRRRNGGSPSRRGLELLLFPVSYYVTFISVLRYSYDRFFLPVALVLAVLSGDLLADLLRRAGGGARGRLVTMAVGLALAFGLARSVTVDLSMLFDVRVEAERAMQGRGHAVGVSGLGAQLPRVDEKAPIERYRRRACERLTGVQVLVFQPTYSVGDFGQLFARALASGSLGFRPVELRRFEPPRWLYDVDAASTNLAWINMPIWVYERDPSLPCRDIQGARRRGP